MSREIRSTSDVSIATAQPQNSNEFKERLVKLIPSEIVTAYITIQGLVDGRPDKQLFTAIAFGSLLILTPLYLRYISNVKKTGQIIFTTIAYIIWVMAIGGFTVLLPQATFFDQFFGSLLLVIYTLLIPFFYKG